MNHNLLLDIIHKKLSKYINYENPLIVSTRNEFNISNNKPKKIIINLEKINNIRRINKFHENVNRNLSLNGYYVSCGETIDERRIRNYSKVYLGFKNIYLFCDFLYKRVIPKLPGIRRIYFMLTKGYNRTISKTEILGRLISCGFSIVDYFEHDNLLYFISKKTDVPKYDMEASYGLLFKMKRVGYQGEIIRVYKLRTMYPYSEYCQRLITKENKLDDSGKIKNDFRVTYLGRKMRRFWIDELPMIINVLKGDLNIVGVRPISKAYFSKYPKDLQNLRIKFKPGLIPPYYADMPKNFNEILDSERIYLKHKLSSPILTDIKYFFKAFHNIVFKGARSN